MHEQARDRMKGSREALSVGPAASMDAPLLEEMADEAVAMMAEEADAVTMATAALARARAAVARSREIRRQIAAQRARDKEGTDVPPARP
jgi:hypothetical protein